MEVGKLTIWCAVILLMVGLLDAGVMLFWHRRHTKKQATLGLPGAESSAALFRSQAERIPSFTRRIGEGIDAVLKRLWTWGLSWLEYCARFWKDEIWPDDVRAMRVIVAVACVFITSTIGYAYAGEVWVEGWQLWAWAMCVVVVVICLMPASRPPLPRIKTWGWPLLLMLAALPLRITVLESVPGRLHVDEAVLADFTLKHVFPEPRRTVSPFRSGAYSQPAMYSYLIRLSLALLGNSITGLRVPSALAGTATILATYAVVAVFQDRRTALLSALIMTTYHFHIHWSRMALNNVWDSLWVPLMVASFAWGWKERWSGGAALSGLALGLSQYFYAGSKLGVFLLAFTIFRLWRQDRDRQRLVVHTGKLLLTAVCTAAPIVLFALRNPAPYFERTGIVIGWQHNAIVEVTGDQINLLKYAWHQAWRSVSAFTSLPDITGFYGPGVPLMIGLAAICFAVGMVWALRESQPVPVVWIVLTILLGGVMMTGAPSSPRYVVSIPAICWLIAIPLNWLIGQGHWPLVLVLLLAFVATDLLFYFGIYVPNGPRDLIHPFPLRPPP